MSRCSLYLLVAALFVGVGAIGCGKKAARPEVVAEEDTPAQSAQQPDVNPEPTIRAAVIEPTLLPPPSDRLHQPFSDATRNGDNPPTDAPHPVDRTMTHKSGPDLYEQVQRGWDSVRFTAPDGRSIAYTAEIHTTRGVIKVALLPEVSPSHARNFIVLARLGYYDGLCFDRVYNEKGEGGDLHCIEAGCPSGTGDEGTGSLGYWVKDEFTPAEKLSHTPGVIGACRLVEQDTAATKFYINLNEARYRDGNYSLFAVVLDGMDVARTISQQPIAADPNDGDRSRPKTPVIIHKIIVHERIKGADEK